MQTVLGTSTVVTGLAAAQTGTPSLSITVAPGAVYSLITTDTNAYGSLGTDSTQIVKQGLVLAPTTLTLPAPTTTGQSVTHLVQVGYSDLDTNNQVLSYYNSANPAVPFTGPGNTGTSQPTSRKGVCVVSVVQGTPATTGSQTTPSPQTGFVGLYTVTLAYGQTTITTGQIITLAGAPFIPYTLPAIGQQHPLQEQQPLRSRQPCHGADQPRLRQFIRYERLPETARRLHHSVEHIRCHRCRRLDLRDVPHRLPERGFRRSRQPDRRNPGDVRGGEHVTDWVPARRRRRIPQHFRRLLSSDRAVIS